MIFPSLLLLLTVASALALLLLIGSYLLVPHRGDLEKGSAYECGFDPFEDARSRFDVRFYLVAILFIVFDLEISFLFPWSLCLATLDPFGYATMAIFLILLTGGFFYEWWRGALDW